MGAGGWGEAASDLLLDRPEVCAPNVDRAGMIPDLLLALVSVAVLLSPVFIDAGRSYESRKSQKTRQDFWNE
jgi:hypothetical protein